MRTGASGLTARSFRGGGGVSRAGVYKPPPATNYTQACEAPQAMWAGAIPLRQQRERHADGSFSTRLVKTYTHPQEVPSAKRLGFSDVGAMYCIGNDEFVQTFPEGVGGRVMQLFPPGHPRGFIYRRESHLLNCFIDKVAAGGGGGGRHTEALRELSGGRPGLVFDGPTGTGKSALMCQAVHFARSRGVLTVYIPNAKDFTHGEWAWPSVLLPGFWDAPDAGRLFLEAFARANRKVLATWPLRVTPGDLPSDGGGKSPATLLELCEWGYNTPAPASVDSQSVAVKYMMDELAAESSRPLLFVIDGLNLFAHETHFRYPHPDFLRTMASWTSPDGATTDIDTVPQELPRIPAARLSLVRALNMLMLRGDANKHFVAATTRDFKRFDGGVSGFANSENDRDASKLDEYAPFDAAKDTVLHPMSIGPLDEYECRSFVRYLVNSGELAGLGWGPLWHYSAPFERKLEKIAFMAQGNAQAVVDHYHQEITWTAEYGRLRQKQNALARKEAAQK